MSYPANKAISVNGGSSSKTLKAPARSSKPFHCDCSPAIFPRSTDTCTSTIDCAATFRPLRPPKNATSSYEGTYRTALVAPKPRQVQLRVATARHLGIVPWKFATPTRLTSGPSTRFEVVKSCTHVPDSSGLKRPARVSNVTKALTSTPLV